MEEKNNQLKKSFWAFIPSITLEDKNLSSTAKLILAEIYALSDQNGVCYPSNKHFSELLGISEIQVSRCINQLKRENWISIEILKEKGNLRIIRINLEGINKKLKTSYQKVKEGYYQKCKERKYNIEKIQLENTSIEGVLPNSLNSVSVIRDYFVQKCQELKGFQPEMNYTKEGALIKKRLKKYTIEQLKDLIDKYFNSYVGEKFGWSLSICLSSPVINQWLAGKLERPKKPYWQGKPMRKRFGKWEVLKNGKWLEFAGNEKEIIFS
mgnify:CR=1 FL=1